MPDPAPPSKDSSPRRGRGMLDMIAAFKFIKAATLLAASLGGFGLLNPRFAQWTEVWLERLALGHGPRLLAAMADRALPALAKAEPKRIVLLAIGGLLYAAVFVVEGVGLARGRRWAEYLTIAVTISFLPFEVVALIHRVSAARAATLVLNVVVVAYLVWRVWSDRRAEHADGQVTTEAGW